MSDGSEEIEGEAGEGEEEEEGGESEKEEEEVKEEPKIPAYVPKINPITQVQNINRNLDMLNSEINVLSSEFMVMSSSLGHKPTYYNVSPQRTMTGTTLNNLGGGYTSPIRNTNAAQTSFWNNPNHINLSPSSYNQPAIYNTSSLNLNPYKGSNYVSPSFGNNYSPSRYNPPSYAPPVQMPPPPMPGKLDKYYLFSQFSH